MAKPNLHVFQIYLLRVTLQDIEPAIFRTVVVPTSYTLREFHQVLQGAFGWQLCHLHAFRDQEGVTYTSAHEGTFAMDMGEDDVDDATVQLSEVLRAKGDHLTYEYDFGDGWEHEVVLLGIEDPKIQGADPAVIDGARKCPPEDCGGPYGYIELMELAERKRQGGTLDNYEEERLEWLGDDYDPEAFDADEANRRVASYKML